MEIFVVHNFHGFVDDSKNLVHENSQLSIFIVENLAQNPDQWLDRKIFIPQKFPCIQYMLIRAKLLVNVITCGGGGAIGKSMHVVFVRHV